MTPSGGPIAILLEAVRDRRLVTWRVGPRDPWPSRQVDDATRPVLLAITDDKPLGGPDRWRTALRLRSWCDAALIVRAAPPTFAGMRTVVEATERMGRLVWVEAAAERVEEWRLWFGVRAL